MRLLWRLGFGVWDFPPFVPRALVLGLALFTGGHVFAQRAVPHIGFVYPAGGQQGQTFTVSLGGQTLGGATDAYVSGAGVHAKVINYERPFSQKEINDLREKLQQLQEKRAAARAKPGAPAFTPEDEKILEDTRIKLATRGVRPTNPALAETLTVEVRLAPDAVPGERELRIKSPAGLSNPVVFCISSLPETVTPVVTTTSNQPPRPNAPNANRAGAARAVEPTITLPAIVNGQIMPGEVDRFHFTARKGQRLTLMTAARALLPYLADAVPGWFQPTLALYDPQGRELAYADDFRFHPDPALLCEIPADGDYVMEIKDAIFRGREDFVYRIAVGELPFVTAIFPLGGRAGESLKVATLGWNLPRSELVIDTLGKGRGIFELAMRNGPALSNPVRFLMDEHPAALEAEPNNSNAEAQLLTLPLTIDGRISEAGDVDVYRFAATAPGTIVAEIIARRLNSPLDSILEIFDESGRRLGMNDDYEDKGAGLLTHHADSRLEVKLPAAGNYFVRVADTQHHGGTEYGYRLRLGAPEPDFALRIVPSSVNVRGGSAVPLTVYALRRDGFTGEIAVGLKDAPPGYILSGGRIPANQDSVRLTLTAPALATDAPQSLTIFGLGTHEGKRIAHVAVPAEDMMQAFAYHHLVPSQELKVQVAGRGTAMRPLTRAPVMIPAGGVARIRIATTAARSAGKIKLELVDPPAGMAIVRCDSNSEFVDVVVSCDATKMKPGTQGNLLFNAVGERSAAAKQGKNAKLQRSTLGTVPAIPFDIAPAGDRST